MKRLLAVLFLAPGFLCITAGIRLQAQETNAPQRRPSREEIRQQLQGLTPEERRVRIAELRAKYGRLDPETAANPFDKLSNTNAPSLEVQSNNAAKLRARAAQPSPEQNRARVLAKIEELRRKKAAGTITSQESRLLDAWEQRLKNAPSRQDATPVAPEPPGLPTPSTSPAPSTAPAKSSPKQQ